MHNNLPSRLLSKNVKIKIYKSLILPVVLYGCETWSLALRDKHILTVSENRMLRRIFGLKRNEVIGVWRKLHNVGLHNLHFSSSIIRIIKSICRSCSTYEEKRNAYRISVGKPAGKRPLKRPRRR
jgi:hypothetical protein